jgi:Rieske 2Fe-2S family protein
VKRRFVCPYHQWSYELDGTLARARETASGSMQRPTVSRQRMWRASGSHLRLCRERTPDISSLKAQIEPYVAPFNLRNAKVAHESRIIERGNWKLVMENNRECYHCAGSHPELTRTFRRRPCIPAPAATRNVPTSNGWSRPARRWGCPVGSGSPTTINAA